MTIFTRPVSAAGRYSFGKPALVVSVTYATLVVAVAAMVTSVLLLADDPGFTAIWLFLASAPLSFVVLWVTAPITVEGSAGAAVTIVLCVAAGLAQAWAVWRVFRGERVDGGAEKKVDQRV